MSPSGLGDGQRMNGEYVDLTMDSDDEEIDEQDNGIETIDLSQNPDSEGSERSATKSDARLSTSNLDSPHGTSMISPFQRPARSALSLAQRMESNSPRRRPSGSRSAAFGRHRHPRQDSNPIDVVEIDDSEDEFIYQAPSHTSQRMGSNQNDKEHDRVALRCSDPNLSSDEEELPDLETLWRNKSQSATRKSSRPPSSSIREAGGSSVPFLPRTEGNQSVMRPSEVPQDHTTLLSPHGSRLPETPNPPLSPVAARSSSKRPTLDRSHLREPSPTPSDSSELSSPQPMEIITDRSASIELLSPEKMPARELDQQRILLSKSMSNTEEIQEWLRQYEYRRHHEHSKNCRIALQHARASVQDTGANFRDKVSPFASLKTVQVPPGKIVASPALKIKSTTYVSLNKTRRRIPGELLAKPISGNVERVPNYTHNTTVRRNILEGDDDKLKYIPFFDDRDENGGGEDKKKQAAARKLERELQQHHKQFSCTSSRESERNLVRQICVTALLRHLCGHCDLRALTFFILDRYELGLRSREAEALRASLGIPNQQCIEVAEKIDHAWGRVFQSSLSDVVLGKERIKDILDSTMIQENPVQLVTAPVQTVGTYTDICCLICNTIHCQVHGDYIDVSDDEEMEGSHQYHHQLVMLYPQTVRRHDSRALSKPKTGLPHSPTLQVCSASCYMKREHFDEEFDWPEEDESFLKAVFVSKSSKVNEAKRSCLLSFALKRPCWQVFQMMRLIGPRTSQPDSRPQTFPGSLEWEPNRKWYDNRTKTLHDKWSQWTDAHDHQKRGQPMPCSHVGPCRKGCPCFNENILCEFYCDCGAACPRRFTGCSCHSGGMNCLSESCICIQMNRECGPECTSCGAVERLNPDNRYDDTLFLTGCQNVVLQRDVAKKAFVGKSGCEGGGYGLYIGESAKKGDYLNEYAGEIITWSEADRRGIIYDLKYTSYLFDLNSRWAIDADRYANKTRFMNHASERDPARNCDAKVMWVRGEHKIKLIAIRNIKPGEELLFNYGEKFAEKHGLDKKQPSSQKTKAKQPQADARAVEKVLDDMQESARTGGHGGRGQVRRARKTAGFRPRVVVPAPRPEDNYEQEDFSLADDGQALIDNDDQDLDPDFVGGNDDEEAEEQEESPPPESEDDHASRRKRIRRLPLKYRG